MKQDVIVEQILVENKKARFLSTSKGNFTFDYLVGSADYSHVDGKLLEKKYSNYTDRYWQKKTFSPSSLLFYLGVNKKIDKLEHHNLFFDEDIETHTNEIYKNPTWPSKPLFYSCCPSKTDASVAPEGKENLFLLMPLAPGLEDSLELREKYFDIMMKRLEKYYGRILLNTLNTKKLLCKRF